MPHRKRNQKGRGLDDAERCWDIGQKVLRKLKALDEAGADRAQVQVFGRPGDEQVVGMSEST